MQRNCRTTSIALAIAAALWISPTSGRAANAQENNRWAVLVGVDQYNQAQDLKYCSSDQLALRDHLVQSGFPEEQVFLLHSKADDQRYLPFKQNIERQLKLVLGLVERGHIVVVSFSGHGIHIDGKSYLCPADADLDDPKSLVELPKVYELLKTCPASLKVMLVDACRNNPRPGGQRSFEATDETSELARSFQEETPDGIVLLNSCTAGEISWEEEKFGHGVFMNFVLEGLRGKGDRNDDGRVSLGELSRYANLQTKLYVARRFNDSQRPFITNESTLDALDFSFSASGLPKSITNTLDMQLRLAPAGSFLMGSPESPEAIGRAYNEDPENFRDEHPQHRVEITKPFYVSAHEVTRAQFERFVNESRYRTDAEKDGQGAAGFDPNANAATEDRARITWRDVEGSSDDHPVVMVSWNDADAFCTWLSRVEGKTYRLPTEAEWEYACRAGTTTRYWTGDSVESLAVGANAPDLDYKESQDKLGVPIEYAVVAARDGFAYTAPVGSFRPNPFGLYDMHGNVWEWCQDGYDATLYARRRAVDPIGPDSETRVIRGGCYM